MSSRGGQDARECFGALRPEHGADRYAQPAQRSAVTPGSRGEGDLPEAIEAADVDACLSYNPEPYAESKDDVALF